VAAVTLSGEAPGPIGRVDVTPSECPQGPVAGSGSLPLQLEIVSLTTTPESAFDSVYCYLSLAFLGGSHVRVPQGEDAFFSRSADGWDIAEHAAGPRRIAFIQPVDEPIALGIECWGWAGDSLLNLGAFSTLISSDQWRAALPQSFPASALGAGGGFEAIFRLGANLPDVDFIPMIGVNCAEPCYMYLTPPYDLGVAESTDDCLAHVSLPDGSPDDGAAAAPWACLELPPSRMLTWEWDPSEQVPRVDLRGFLVYTYTSLYAYRNFEPEWVDPIGSAAQIMPMHLPGCGRTYVMSARHRTGRVRMER
jgi:hypothetical protein